MKKKNLSYKFDNRNITHNIEKIVDINYLSIERINNYILNEDDSRLFITYDIFEKYVKNNIIWPTEKCYYDKEYAYLGAAVIRTKDNRDILAYFIDNKENIEIKAVDYLYPIKSKIHHRLYFCFPSRIVKCFETLQEYNDDANKKKAKNRYAVFEKLNRDELNKQIPRFNMVTPKFKVLEIYNKTACAPNIKVDDIIHGELPVIKNDNYDKPETMLYGDSTNFIHVFINGEDVKTISPVFFQNMFFYNFRVEEIVS